MKYLLQILLLSLLLIPYYVFECLVAIWTFKTERVKSLTKDYKDTVEDLYRRAFPRKSRKPRFNLQKPTRF
jgi:type II secretory pathway component PulL